MSAAVERLHLDGIEVIEVWNRPLGNGRLFWEAVGVPRLERLRAEGAAFPGERLGGDLRKAVVLLRDEWRCDTVFLGGGLVRLEGLADALEGLPVALSADAEWVARRGGESLLASRGLEGIVIDVGQTSVKAMSGPLSSVVHRDLDMLPRRFIDPTGRARPQPDRDRRLAVAGMLAQAIRELDSTLPTRPRSVGVVLGLCSPVDDALVPGPCTYGWERDAELVPTLHAQLEAELGSRPWLGVLNDAELAAESARRVLRPPPGRRILCLTLGFGPGAALLTT